METEKYDEPYSLIVRVPMKALAVGRDPVEAGFQLSASVRDRLERLPVSGRWTGDGVGDGLFEIFCAASEPQGLHDVRDAVLVTAKWPAATSIEGWNLESGERVFRDLVGGPREARRSIRLWRKLRGV